LDINELNIQFSGYYYDKDNTKKTDLERYSPAKNGKISEIDMADEEASTTRKVV